MPFKAIYHNYAYIDCPRINPEVSQWLFTCNIRICRYAALGLVCKLANACQHGVYHDFSLIQRSCIKYFMGAAS